MKYRFTVSWRMTDTVEVEAATEAYARQRVLEQTPTSESPFPQEDSYRIDDIAYPEDPCRATA